MILSASRQRLHKLPVSPVSLSMSTHVTKVVAGCFAVLRQLNSICRSLARSRLSDWLCLWSWHGWITAKLFLLDCLQTSSIGFSLLSMQRLAWFNEHLGMIMFRRCWRSFIGCDLRVPERIEFKLCALVYKCLNGNGPAYLADSLQRVTDVQSRRRLRSSSSSSLIIPVTRHATLGDRAFPVVAARAWNALPDYVISAPTFASFCTALKTYLFPMTFWHWQHVSHWLCNVVLKRCALAPR